MNDYIQPSQTRNLMEAFWSIKKVLTGRDIRDGQVIIPKRQVEDYILPLLSLHEQKLLNDGKKSPIMMLDVDDVEEHPLNLWKNGSSSYVLTNGWKDDFVRRRELVVGSQIGLCWDQRLGMMRFTVLDSPPFPLQD